MSLMANLTGDGITFPMKRRRFLFAAVAAWTLGASASAHAASHGAASAFIRDFGAKAIAVLQSPELSLTELEMKFRALLRNGFDIRLIGRFALGRYWRQASAEMRRDYLDLFGEYVVKTYSARLGGYKGESLVVVSQRSLGKRKDVMVNTRINRPSGPPIKAAWRVRSGKNGLRIIDVMVEGISMVVTQRDEFASVVRRHGLDGLIETLRARTSMVNAKR